MSDWVETRIHPGKDGSVTFERVQDVEPILENNHRLRSEDQKSDLGRHIATIPNVLIEKWINEEGAPVLAMNKDEFAKFIKHKLDDPDYAYLRTDKKQTFISNRFGGL